MAEWEEGENPLLNELVIDNISKYLSFEELKVCRRLNHLWKKTTSRTFLKLCPELFLHSKKDGEFIQFFIRPTKQMKITQFMEIYSDPNHSHPHAQLLRQYRNFEVRGLEKEFIPIFYNFMTRVGPQMTSLNLSDIEVLRSSLDLMDIVLSKYTPNLEELRLESLYEIDDYQPNDLKTGIEWKENKHLHRLSVCFTDKIQWLDVLSRYPKLKALSLSFLGVREIQEIATGLVAMRKASETKLKLTELKISHVSSLSETDAEKVAHWETIRDLLKTAKLPLENISFDESASEISLALIQHYGENLTSLTLERHIPQPLPLMKALERMTVHESDDMTFLTKVPNLKSLGFFPTKWSPQIRFPESAPSLLVSLIKLKSGFFKGWNVAEMEQLVLWMPNVQNLEMHLNNTTFSLICQHLPNLKELIVNGEDLDDSGVLGEFEEGSENEGCRPNITNLKALETFKMDGYPVLEKGLTEKSVFHGFSLIPKLTNLAINVKSELSADAMLSLNLNRGIRSVEITVGFMAQSDIE